MRVSKVRIPIYEMNLIIVVEKDFHVSNKKFKLELEENEKDINTPHAWTVNRENEIYLLLNPSHLDYNTICHELTHVLLFIADQRNIKLDVENDEPLAYLNGYIGEKVFKFADRCRKRNS